MIAIVSNRTGVRLDSTLKASSTKRNLQAAFCRSDKLAKSIAKTLKAGKTVVLLDVDYKSKLFGEQKTLEESVKTALLKVGENPKLAENVINLDHHSKTLGNKTATELAFDNLETLRNIEGDVVAMINHGDTDAIVSAWVVNNLDRNFADNERNLLIAAARASDHSEGDFLSPTKQLTPAVRLSLAIDQTCFQHGIVLFKVWDKEDAQISKGIQQAFLLITSAFRNTQSLYSSFVENLVESNPTRLSHRIVEKVSQGIEVQGVSIDRSVEGKPIVTVDVTVPGLDNFNPIPAYQASSKPAIILIIRKGRVVGVGRNNEYAEWLNLAGKANMDSFYKRLGMRLKGGAHAGGANVPRDAFDSLPSSEEALSVAREFIRESLAQQ